jgi:thiamine kinase-like enzyme
VILPIKTNELIALLEGKCLQNQIHGEKISVLSTKGITHDHWRIGNSNYVLRIPKMSQWGMKPDNQLAYESTAFQRASKSGHCPELIATIPICEKLPRGALLVEFINGHAPRLPSDLYAISNAFSAIHKLPLPSPNKRKPLQYHTKPIAEMLKIIEEQATFLSKATLSKRARKEVEEELFWAKRLKNQGEPEVPICLVGTDTHPGNFLIDTNGKAWFVDLEKALYGVPYIDLAHATLAVSTGWDPDCATKITTKHVGNFYRYYHSEMNHIKSNEFYSWALNFRRLTWLRTMTWFARYQVAWQDNKHPASRNKGMTQHIVNHITHSFEAETIISAREDWLEPKLLIEMQ